MILNAIVLILEVLYYSLFLKFAKRNSKLWKYILSFSVATIFNIVFSYLKINEIVIYLLFMLIAILLIKLLDKDNTNLFDLLFLFIIMVVKIAIEGLSYLILYNMMNKIAFTFVIDAFKFVFIILFKNTIRSMYKKLKNKWNNNNFYIRYIFNIFLFIFIIMSFVFIIIK